MLRQLLAVVFESLTAEERLAMERSDAPVEGDPAGEESSAAQPMETTVNECSQCSCEGSCDCSCCTTQSSSSSSDSSSSSESSSPSGDDEALADTDLNRLLLKAEAQRASGVAADEPAEREPTIITVDLGKRGKPILSTARSSTRPGPVFKRRRTVRGRGAPRARGGRRGRGRAGRGRAAGTAGTAAVAQPGADVQAAHPRALRGESPRAFQARISQQRLIPAGYGE